VGAATIARELIAAAAAETFQAWGGDATESFLQEVVGYFDGGGVLQVGDTASAKAAVEGFGTVTGLLDAVREIGLASESTPGHTAAACERVLESLVAARRLSRTETGKYGRIRRRPKQGPQGPFGPTTFDV
jgi:magnesium chelatase subunit I